MDPVLCILAGCNGAGKTTLARELLPRLGLMRFLNADEIARGLSPLDPSLSAFRARRLLLEEARALIAARASFAIESTLSGKTYFALIREAKARGYRFVLHYIVIGSAGRVARATGRPRRTGGGCAATSRTQPPALAGRNYLPLADDWGAWDNQTPPPRQIANSEAHTLKELNAMLDSQKLQEVPPAELSEMAKVVLEAGRVATEKMLDYYRRMDIEVTPEMTLAPEKPARVGRNVG